MRRATYLPTLAGLLALVGDAGVSSVLRDGMKILAPTVWHQHLLKGKPLWLPEFDDWRSVEASLTTSSAGPEFWQQATLEAALHWAEFAGWAPCGGTPGFPQSQWDSPPNVMVELGTYLLLGCGGSNGESTVIWLVGAETVKW